MGIETASFSPDGQTLITGSTDGYLCEWDVETGERRRVLLDPQGKEDERPSIVIVDENGHEEDAPFEFRRLSEVMRGSPILCVRFAPDGSRFVVGAENGWIVIWNASSRGELFAWEAHECLVSAVEISPDGRWLATGSRENGAITLRVWRIPGRAKYRFEEVFSAHSHVGGVTSVSFSGDGRYLAFGGYTNSGYTAPVLYDVETRKSVGSFLWDMTSALQLSPDAKLLATGDAFGTFSLWDVAREERIFSEQTGSGPIMVVQFAPDGRSVATGDQDGGVRVWDVVTRRLAVRWDFPGATYALWFARDGRQLRIAESAEGAVVPTVHREPL